MRVLFLGDIVGKPGRRAVAAFLPTVRRDKGIDLALANAENASGGIGLTPKSARELFEAGLDGLTSGNHVWKHKDLHAFLDKEERLVRPANFPAGAPGRGAAVIKDRLGTAVALINLQGRTYMEPIDCPFAKADELLAELPAEAKVRIVDFHAEATSEKTAMAHYLDGRVSAVLGTHTHVQTSDALILPGGTASLTDLGMCGPFPSCLGMDPKDILQRFTTGRPTRFNLSKQPAVLQGAIFEIEESTGKAVHIETWNVRPGETF